MAGEALAWSKTEMGTGERKNAPIAKQALCVVSPEWAQQAGDLPDRANPRNVALFDQAKAWAESWAGKDAVFGVRLDLDEKGGADELCDYAEAFICNLTIADRSKHYATDQMWPQKSLVLVERYNRHLGLDLPQHVQPVNERKTVAGRERPERLVEGKSHSRDHDDEWGD